jgi:type IV pilus assembly protein PilM
MAASKGIYALNLGTQTISLAEFVRSANGGLVLARMKQAEILGDPAADATRTAQTKVQVQQLVADLKLQGRKVNYAIASHVIFTRPVTLPSVGDASQVEQIVGFEAQQNVPYPIAEVVWDWQLLDAGDGGQVEVILAAIKSDLLDEINSAVQEGGLQPAVVDIAPMALYNAFRYNYPDAEGCSIVVDIGSRTTNLLFCEPGKIFPRRLNIGGSSITTAIAKDFSCSFAEADERKVKDGFVSLGGTYAEPDDVEIARISKITRNQMTRLHQEIARSITFYRSEHSGSQPQRVLIGGGTASLPYIREFFQEKFPGMEVEYFNPLRNVAVADSLDVESIGRSAHMFGELVGLALRGAGSCPMELNLRPSSLVKAEKQAAQRPYIIAAGVCALAALGAWWQYYERAAAATAEVTQSLVEKASPLQRIKDQTKAARDEIATLGESAKPLTTVAAERTYWTNVIADLNARLPKEYIWITSFEIIGEAKKKEEAEPEKPRPGRPRGGDKEERKEPSVMGMIKGLYLSREAKNIAGPAVVDEFVTNLKGSPYVQPSEDPDDGFKRGNDDNPAVWAYPFEIPLKFQHPIATK